MALLVTDKQRETLIAHHLAHPGYGADGTGYVELLRQLIGRFQPEDILDYGSGKGVLKVGAMLGGLKVPIREYDPGMAGKLEVTAADLVLCLNVLQCVETDCVEAVLDHLRELTLKACLMVIDHTQALAAFPDGRNLHLTQRPRLWWIKKLSSRFSIQEILDAPNKQGQVTNSVLLLVPGRTKLK